MKKILLLSTLLAVCVAALQAQAQVSLTNATCFGACNGGITVTAVGGSSYHWSNSATGAVINNLCAGSYTCTVFNSSQVPIDTVTATVLQAAQLVITTTSIDANCAGYNGSITPHVSGGTPPYTYAWSNGQTEAIVTNAASGTYSITLTDANGCTATTAATIAPGLGSLLVTDSLTIPAQCNVCNGVVYTTVQGGIGPYRYLWNGTNAQVTPPLCAGVNTLVVTDVNNCSGTAQFIVNNNTGLAATATNTNVTCARPVDTTTVTVTGGSQLLTFSWGDNGNPDAGVASPRTHTYTAYGIYTIAVTDSAGCAYYFNDTVANHGVIVTEAYSNPAYCYSPNSGSLQVAVTGGTPPYTYRWNNAATTDSLVNVPAGNYAVTVTDATGCTTTYTGIITQENSESGYYAYELIGIDFCNQHNGSATAQVTGGTQPYRYLWSNSATTAALANLGAGPYNLTVTDASGCLAISYNYIDSLCYNLITGVVFSDTNGNCTYDSSEAYTYASIIASGSNGIFYGNTYNTGNYQIEVPDTGTYTISLGYIAEACNSFTPCNNISNIVTFAGLGDTSANHDFGIRGTQNFDLTMHPGWSQANPGFVKEYWIMGYNQGTGPFADTATIVFNYDSNLVYQSSLNQLPVVNLAAHTLTWQIYPVPAPGYDWATRLRNFFLVPATLPPGYLLKSSFSITPTNGDCEPGNNFMSFSETCTGSHDPNLKTVSPSGPVDENDSVLNYTIYFQNTGNAATHFISVTDTLSPYLDPTTVVNLASSAPYSNFGLSGKGVLTWTFNPYFLPDSLADATGSKGFIKFSVKRRLNAPAGSVIANTASVYFDYNQPVVTNTVADTVVTNTVPAGIALVANSEISATASPNPFSDFTNIVVTGVKQAYNFQLYDVTGRLQQTITSLNTNQFKLDRAGLADGVYFYRIVISNTQVAYGKVVVQR